MALSLSEGFEERSDLFLLTLAVVDPEGSWKTRLEVEGVKSDFVSILFPAGCVVLNRGKAERTKLPFMKGGKLYVARYRREVGGQSWGVWGNHELGFRYVKNEVSVGHPNGDAGRKVNM